MQDSSKVSIDIADFHQAPVPTELQRIAGGSNKTVVLLRRQLPKIILDDVLTQFSPPPPIYITGPVGKSTILFMTAAAVLDYNDQIRSQKQPAAPSKTPIFLLYVANVSELITLNPEKAAAELCKMVKSLNRQSVFAEVLDVLDANNASNLERWNRFCLKLRQTRIKNLILVDQWNAITEAPPSVDHPLYRFRTISSNIGFSKFVGAVSSSFTPIDAHQGVFCDAEALCAEHRLELWSLEDMKALGRIWREREKSVDVDESTLVALFEYTVGIPQLLELFAATRLSPNPLATVDDPDWQQQCTEYYVGRLNIISRDLSDLNLRISFQANLASLFLRKREWPRVNSELASPWLNTGLLIPDESRVLLIPVNRFVLKAIDVFVLNEQTSLLKNLYANKATIRRALQLFFFLQLLSNGRATFTGTDLRNTESSVLQFDHERPLQIIDVHQDFASNPQLYLDRHNGGQPLKVGSMLTPTWASHSVADAVLFVQVENYTETQLIFIRVSSSSYATQPTKIPHLHPMVHTKWMHSVLQSYQTAFGITTTTGGKPNRDIAKGKLPRNVHYLFVTTTADEAVTDAKLVGRSSQGSLGHHVFVMRKEHIKKMNEPLWQEMTQGTQSGENQR